MTKNQANPTTCSNCGKSIRGTGVLSPTLAYKRRNQCLKCAKLWFSATTDTGSTAKNLWVIWRVGGIGWWAGWVTHPRWRDMNKTLAKKIYRVLDAHGLIRHWPDPVRYQNGKVIQSFLDWLKMPLPTNFVTPVIFGRGNCRTCGKPMENIRVLFCDKCRTDRRERNLFGVVAYLDSYVRRHSHSWPRYWIVV